MDRYQQHTSLAHPWKRDSNIVQFMWLGDGHQGERLAEVMIGYGYPQKSHFREAYYQCMQKNSW